MESLRGGELGPTRRNFMLRGSSCTFRLYVVIHDLFTLTFEFWQARTLQLVGKFPLPDTRFLPWTSLEDTSPLDSMVAWPFVAKFLDISVRRCTDTRTCQLYAQITTLSTVDCTSVMSIINCRPCMLWISYLMTPADGDVIAGSGA